MAGKSPFVFKVPPHLCEEGLPAFYHGWQWHIPTYGRLVELNFDEATTVAPWILTLFTSHLLRLESEFDKKSALVASRDSAAGNYVAQSGLDNLIPGNIERSQDDSPSAVTITRLSSSREIPKFANAAISMLQIGDEEVEGALEYSLIELLRNVVQHSNSAYGAIACVGLIPQTDIVELCVADSGVGIRNALKDRYHEAETDLSSLRLAVLPHVSGTFERQMYSSMKDNAGLGLFFVKEIAIRSGGEFFLGTGTAMSHHTGTLAAKRLREEIIGKRGGWHGTFAVLRLKKGLIGDFSVLLEQCRQIAGASRDDPYLQALEFLDEVSEEITKPNIIKVRNYYEDVEQAAKIREEIIIPALKNSDSVILDFSGIRVITQSFAHAIFYKLLKEQMHIRHKLSVMGCNNMTKAAIIAVTAYARTPDKPE